MTTTPNSLVTPQNVFSSVVTATNAKTTLTDTSNVVRLIAGTDIPNGALVKRLQALHRGTDTTDIQCQIYRSYNGGTNVLLSDTAVLVAYTFAANTLIPSAVFNYNPDNPLRLKAGEDLWVAIATSSASGINFVAEYEVF